MSNATKLPATKCKKAAKILNDFLNSFEDRSTFVGDAKVLTHQEWLDRGEKYGQQCFATLLLDGSWLYDAFNYNDSSKFAQGKVEKLRAALEAEGFYFELGYAWSLHIYE